MSPCQSSPEAPATSWPVRPPGGPPGTRQPTAPDEVGPVCVVAEDGRQLDPPDYHVVEDVRGIQAGLARHRNSRRAQGDQDWNIPCHGTDHLRAALFS